MNNIKDKVVTGINGDKASFMEKFFENDSGIVCIDLASIEYNNGKVTLLEMVNYKNKSESGPASSKRKIEVDLKTKKSRQLFVGWYSKPNCEAGTSLFEMPINEAWKAIELRLFGEQHWIAAYNYRALRRAGNSALSCLDKD